MDDFDLFLLNALSIVIEFIGVTLGINYPGIPKLGGVIVATMLIIAIVGTTVAPWQLFFRQSYVVCRCR